jgi:homoserine kinase
MSGNTIRGKLESITPRRRLSLMFTIRVPATIANLGPGFDSFGMAVTLYNQFVFTPAERDAIAFSTNSSVDISVLAREADANTAGNIIFKAMDRLYGEARQVRPQFHVEIEADIPVARGLGSSSTAIVAGLVAANEALGKLFDPKTLLDIAIAMEGHPDNVAPSLLGGVVLYDTAPYRLPWPQEWRIMVLSPDYPVLTEDARNLLPRTVPMEDSIFNLRKSSVLTYALLREDPEALRAGLHDRLHQPYRRQCIKEYDTIEKIVMDDGAFGMIISGSGSTMAVFYPTVLHAFLLEKLENTIRDNHWNLCINDVSVDFDGARILSTSLK